MIGRSLVALLPLLGYAHSHETQRHLKDGTAACDRACAVIAAKLGDRLHYGMGGNFRMWDTKQEDNHPACRVEPTTSQEVSFILDTVVEHSCNFAVKSGGHSRFPDSSNSVGGVTIDLVRINDITISEGSPTVRVGSGAKWVEVYHALEKEGLMVAGGRVADVGVGGLLLGGGISFFSPKYGWAIDRVREFELVLPDGSVTLVTETSNPDLYFALRGGGNNFGIVTYFTIETFPQGHLLGGSNFYSQDKDDLILDALHNFYQNSESDTDAAVYAAFVYFQSYGMLMSAVQMTHAKPEFDPPIFDEFKNIPTMGPGTLRIDSMSNFSLEIQAGSPPGSRNIYSTLTLIPSVELNRKVVKIFQEEVEAVKAVEGLLPALILQPLYYNSVKLGRKKGGNALGIKADGHLTILGTAFAWKHASDDTLMYAFFNRVMDRSRNAASEMGLLHPYLYQNWASEDQDVYAGYGIEEVARLREIQKVVDPRGIFQKGGLCGGYFKFRDKQHVDGGSGGVRDEL